MSEARRPVLPARVARLPDTLVNQIAAGEVIERPAAAVKELVENALDAGATRVRVALREGGIARIEVEDDGCGIAPDDLRLAVERHCTSKLPGRDLARIATLGFRGEALPSIGAAARLAITSRGQAAESAWRIAVAGGVVADVAPASAPPGTLVLVEDLFFATPARRKFLKSPRIEAAHVEAVLRRLAFAFPAVAFRLAAEDRVVLDLPAGSAAERARLLLEPGGEALLAVAHGRDALALEGFALGPAASRATPAAQFLVVNDRPVTDPLLRTAVRVAYRDVIERGRHAACALSLRLPAEEVDVNVHPAKTELRFRDPDAVRALLIGGLRRALGIGAGRDASRVVAFPRSRPAMALAPAPGPRAAGGFAEASLPFAAATPPEARIVEPAPDAAETAFPLGAPVAQVLDTYVIAVAADGDLVLVDQHAAHERLTHERLRAEHAGGAVRAQALLLPEVVELPAVAAAAIGAGADALAALGLHLEGFGAGAVLVRAVPALLGAASVAPLVRDVAEGLLAEGEDTALPDRLDAALARMACHGSIRAGRRLGREEMSALLRAMEATPRAATCSHGRPTVLKLARAELERMFGRN